MRIQLFCLLAALTTLCACNKHHEPVATVTATDTIPTMVMQIQKVSRLYTTEVHLHKIITHDDRKKLSGTFMSKSFSIDLPLGNRKIAIPMDATLKAYIDFDHFSKTNVHKHNGKIEIVLPDPKIVLTGTRINHREVKEYVALTRSNFSDAELASYEKQGRDAIIRSIPDIGVIQQARESAARILIPLIQQLGYNETDITVSFRKEFTLNDLSTLIDRPTAENRNTLNNGTDNK